MSFMHLVLKKQIFQCSDYPFIMQLLSAQFFLIRPSTWTDRKEMIALGWLM